RAVIVDVEPSTAVRHTEVAAAKTMIERAHDYLDLWPERLIADTSYGSAEMLNWLANDRGIEPHIPVFDKSKRTDDTFSREDFVSDHASDTYRCPGGKTLRRYRREFTVPRIGVMKDNSLRYRASKHDCEPCPLKPRCCPNAPARKVLTKAHVTWLARSPDRGLSDFALSAQKGRDAVCPPQTHPKARPLKAARAVRCPRRIPPRCNRPEPPQAGQARTRTASNPLYLRKQHSQS